MTLNCTHEPESGQMIPRDARKTARSEACAEGRGDAAHEAGQGRGVGAPRPSS